MRTSRQMLAILAVLGTCAGALADGLNSAGAGKTVRVTNAPELRAAIEQARAGDVIILASGRYDITANLVAQSVGTSDAPIVVRADVPGGAKIHFDALEGFMVSGAHWQFEALDIEGVCAVHSECEHAFHLVGDADFTVIRNNLIQGFNAHIKSNGVGAPRAWPDDVLVEGNELFNVSPRNTSNPVTPIDVVGGRRWVVRGNFIHDHAKHGGDNISYAAFLKGHSRDGLFERNLVICELLHTGHVRLGLSFGGGGSGPDPICEDDTCSPEHHNGVMRNNIIANCPTDVGIYVNEGANVRIYNNTLYRTTGIDVRFAATSAYVRNNLLSGRIRARAGARLRADSNLDDVSEAAFRSWFVNPDGGDFRLINGETVVDAGERVAEVTDDFCGQPRDAAPDLGAVEFSADQNCETRLRHATRARAQDLPAR